MSRRPPLAVPFPVAVSVATVLALLAAAAPAHAIEVVSVGPPPESTSADVTTSIEVTFDVPVDPESVSKATFRAFGRWSGPADGERALSADGRTLTLTPALPFSAGELVHTNLSRSLLGADGSALRAEGYAWRFHTRAARAGPALEETHRASVRDPETPGTPVLLYGGLACDLDRDGYLDLSIVNEGTGDLRILQNADDGSATFAPFLRPPPLIGAGASPSEADDFDQDGAIDFCTANHEDDGGGEFDPEGSVTVLFGNGSGGFLPTTTLGGVPDCHGMAILDVDGDGDRDIVVTSRQGGNGLRLLRNQGGRTFADAEAFAGGANGPWGLSTADMDGDGIYDLVVGFYDGQAVNVLLGNGDGTFRDGTPVDVGGVAWMVDTGDVDGDGDVDVVATLNSPGGAVLLLGDGTGALGSPQAYSRFAGHTPATDFGDLDGDGDLDWVLSGYSAGEWRILENDGDGGFTRLLDVRATRNPGCAVVFDADRDGDLDLALLDEVNDEVVILQNGPLHVRAALAPSRARLVLPGAGRRAAPRLTARGTLHLGPGVEDLTPDVTVTVGTRDFRTELTRIRRRGRRLVFDGDGARLVVDTGAGSRATFVLTVRDDLTDAVGDADDLPLSLVSDAFEAGARIDVGSGRFRLAGGGLHEPLLSVSRLRATLLGDAADRFAITLRIPGDAAPPAVAPTFTVTVGDFAATLPGGDFALRRGVFRLRTPTAGVVRASYAPRSGVLSILGRNVDLGPVEGGELTVSVDAGEGAVLASVRAAVRRRRLRY